MLPIVSLSTAQEREALRRVARVFAGGVVVPDVWVQGRSRQRRRATRPSPLPWLRPAVVARYRKSRLLTPDSATLRGDQGLDHDADHSLALT